jgi:endo-1,4-beta-D-glucanase Y
MRGRLAVIGLLLLLFSGPAGAQQPMITPQDWQAYKAKFLDVSGRIVDDGNGGISHSEGQGYGLLLAYLADNPVDFEQIWYFTRTELLIRDDGLAAWSWNPAKTPHIDDINDATDGDLLIAYALARGGDAWGRADYTQAATKIATTLLDKAIVRSGGRTLLLPGVTGFSAADRSDGPVINPSYLIFEAFPVLNALVPSEKWQQLSDDGHALIASMQFGSQKLPADWVSLKRQPKPADGLEKEFGYNALRIPLYLMRGGIEDRPLLAQLHQGMAADDGSVRLFDLAADSPKARLDDPGYQIINHILACVTSGTELPGSAKQFAPTLYFPSTLHLLGLSYIAEKHPECL